MLKTFPGRPVSLIQSVQESSSHFLFLCHQRGLGLSPRDGGMSGRHTGLFFVCLLFISIVLSSSLCFGSAPEDSVFSVLKQPCTADCCWARISYFRSLREREMGGDYFTQCDRKAWTVLATAFICFSSSPPCSTQHSEVPFAAT